MVYNRKTTKMANTIQILRSKDYFGFCCIASLFSIGHIGHPMNIVNQQLTVSYTIPDGTFGLVTHILNASLRYEGKTALHPACVCVSSRKIAGIEHTSYIIPTQLRMHNVRQTFHQSGIQCIAILKRRIKPFIALPKQIFRIYFLRENQVFIHIFTFGLFQKAIAHFNLVNTSREHGGSKGYYNSTNNIFKFFHLIHF